MEILWLFIPTKSAIITTRFCVVKEKDRPRLMRIIGANLHCHASGTSDKRRRLGNPERPISIPTPCHRYLGNNDDGLLWNLFVSLHCLYTTRVGNKPVRKGTDNNAAQNVLHVLQINGSVELTMLSVQIDSESVSPTTDARFRGYAFNWWRWLIASTFHIPVDAKWYGNLLAHGGDDSFSSNQIGCTGCIGTK